MGVTLVVREGKHAGMRIKIPGPKFFIGRADDCHLRPGSGLISRHHCVILVDEDAVSVRDFGSKNGTLVNGEMVRGEEELESGDLLQVGPLHFQVEIKLATQAAQKPKVASPVKSPVGASSPPEEEDLDISDWLGEDDVEQAVNETAVSANDSTNLVENRQYQPPESKKTAQEPQQKTKKQQPEAETQTHRIHPIQKPKTVDSQKAAEDTLRQFFHRK